jgi:hypothetical protein
MIMIIMMMIMYVAKDRHHKEKKERLSYTLIRISLEVSHSKQGVIPVPTPT